MKNGLRINGVDRRSLYENRVDARDDTDPGFREMESWIESIRAGREPVVKAGEALVVAEILDAIYESSDTGQPVFLE